MVSDAGGARPRTVLVTGAEGFLGRHVVGALRAAGHDVIRGVRPGSRDSETPDAVGCDFGADLDVRRWLPRLAGVDAVVNCVGILRETRRDAFEAVHVAAPRALFEACERRGVSRVVQISALGVAEDGEFIASKHRGDAVLEASRLEWVILRPSVVYSTDGSYGGTSLLRAMAALPGVLVLPGTGRQLIDPVDAADLAEIVLRLLATGAATRRVVEIVGPETLTIKHYLLAWRRWLRVPPPRMTLRVPGPLVGAIAAVGEWSGSGPLGRTMNAMLARGNVGEPGSREATSALLGRMPRSVDQALAKRPSYVQDRWRARLYVVEPTLRHALAVVWVFSAWVGFSTPAAEVASLLEPVGIGREIAVPLALAASGLDLLLGILLLARWRPTLVGALMIASLLGYTLVIGTWLPALWMEPFGGLLKNLALLPAVAAMMAMADRR